VPGEAGIGALVEALQYTDILAPFAMLELRLRGGDAFGLLIEALNDERSSTRAGAAELLGDIGDARALEALTNLFIDTSFEVGKAAGRAAGRLADEEHLQAYLEILQSSRPDSIRSIPAIYALGAAKWQPGGERLLQIASDPGFSRSLRRATFHALGEMGYREAEGFLLKTAKDVVSGEPFRGEAIKALGWFRSDESLDFLVGALRDVTDFHIRSSAAYALGMMHDRAEALEELMLAVDREKTVIVLSAIVESLGELGDPASITAIEAARVKGVRDVVCDAAIRAIELSTSD
jgi:HEAT repeat protein